MGPFFEDANNFLVSYYDSPGRDTVEDLMSAYEKYLQLEFSIQELKGEYAADLIPVLKKIALANKYFYFYPSAGLFLEDTSPTTSSSNYLNARISRNFSDPGISGRSEARVLPLKAHPYVETSYRNGKNRLEHVVEVYRNNPSYSPDQHILAAIELADWEFMSGRYQAGKKLYSQSQQLIENLDDRDLAELLTSKLFASPIPVVDPKLFGLLVIDVDREKQLFNEEVNFKLDSIIDFVEASFKVRDNGTAHDLEVIDSQSSTKNELRVRELRGFIRTELLFRPDYIETETKSSKRLTYRFSRIN